MQGRECLGSILSFCRWHLHPSFAYVYAISFRDTDRELVTGRVCVYTVALGFQVATKESDTHLHCIISILPNMHSKQHFESLLKAKTSREKMLGCRIPFGSQEVA